MKPSELVTPALRTNLDSFYEQSDAEKQKTLQQVRGLANKNPSAFVQLVHQQAFNELNDLPVFYQALATDITHWDDFFMLEAARLFKLAEAANEPRKVLTHLNEFCFINAAEFKHRESLIALLQRELANERAVFRYYAASLLPDFIKDKDVIALGKLRQLMRDSEWRIRYLVYLDLKDIGALTTGDKLSWLDRLRAWTFNASL